MTHHNVNLNIHYTAPDEVWDAIGAVYRTMPYWADEDTPCWLGKDIDLRASVEPGGIQIAGIMPEEIWQTWYALLKQKLTQALGYEIGELEDGCEFRYYDQMRGNNAWQTSRKV